MQILKITLLVFKSSYQASNFFLFNLIHFGYLRPVFGAWAKRKGWDLVLQSRFQVRLWLSSLNKCTITCHLSTIKIPDIPISHLQAYWSTGPANNIFYHRLVPLAPDFNLFGRLAIQLQFKIPALLFVIVFRNYFTRGRSSCNKIQDQIQKRLLASR